MDETTPLAVRQRFLERLRWTLADHERELWALVAVALVLDLALTIFGFELGFVERNQIARQLYGLFGIPGIIGLKLGALALALLLHRLLPRDYRAIVPLALAIPWWVGVLSNGVNIAILVV